MSSHLNLIVRFTAFVLLFMLFPGFQSSTTARKLGHRTKTITGPTSMPLAFTANRGQWDGKVKFCANAGGATMWFSGDGALYQFTRTIQSDDDNRGFASRKRRLTVPGAILGLAPTPRESIVIRASFVGANPNSQPTGLDIMEYKCNYFIGNDPTQWHTDVPNYQGILYKDIYDGIDLKYFGNGQQMEYDFIVSPGADYRQIEIRYEGAESLFINSNGELVVTTRWGEVTEQRPVIYQLQNDIRIPVEGEYILTGVNSFGFKLGNNYDPALLLVIDPILNYSTYLGGNQIDFGEDVVTDGSGVAYVAGFTESHDFPTFNPYQDTLLGGGNATVTKLSSSGTSLIYSTYIGGSVVDEATAIAIDASGAVYVTGRTRSDDFPTVNAFQATKDFGYDAFVTKLSPAGNSLMYSTYLGGATSEFFLYDDYAFDIAVDASGAAYVTGLTESSNFPMSNPFIDSLQGLGGFVTKLSSSGNSLIYSTYLDGSFSDIGIAIAVDASGSAYVTGWTSSHNFPTLGPYQGTFQGGFWDTYVTKFSSAGNSLVYSTYLGGDSSDIGYGITVDAFGAAYVTGETNSTNFPVLSPYQGSLQGKSDVFVTKLLVSGSGIEYSTYLGGAGEDWGGAIAVDDSGAAYITGHTASNNFPMFDPYQGSYQGGEFDAFVTQLSATGNSLLFSTFLGGSLLDQGIGIAVDGSGAVFITGWTTSLDFPIYSAFQETHQSIAIGFVTKFSDSDDLPCPIKKTGDVNEDEQITSSDIISVVSYVFKNGAPPSPCEAAGDVNCSGSVTSADIIYMVGHVFKGGPEPCDACFQSPLIQDCQ